MTTPWIIDPGDDEDYQRAGYNTPQGQPTDTDWSSVDPSGWRNFQDYVKGSYGLTNNTTYKSRANKAAAEFYQREGRWPSASELAQDQTANRYVYNVAVGYSYLPPSFEVDGAIYYNDPYDGPVRIKALEDLNKGLGPGGIDAMATEGTRYASGAWRRPDAVYTRDQFLATINSLSPARSSGGGGGGGGRAARAYDRDQLIEAATDRWKGLMLEDPDAAAIGNIVDSFMAKGNSFWMSKGGNLDFDTFIVNKMRDTSRYKTLYRKMDEFQTEEEYMARYRGTVEQFGLNERATKRETEAGLTSGAGLAGFTDRVAKTREARLSNQGGFSQQLAASMSQMGAMG